MAKGRLAERAKSDWQRLTTVGGFEEDITFKTPDSFSGPAVEVTVQGLATKHHLDVDTDGNAVSSKNVHVSVSEQVLVDAGYPIRDSEPISEVSMINHKVGYADSTGVLKEYVILQSFPDETVGIITFILGDYSETE